MLKTKKYNVTKNDINHFPDKVEKLIKKSKCLCMQKYYWRNKEKGFVYEVGRISS